MLWPRFFTRRLSRRLGRSTGQPRLVLALAALLCLLTLVAGLAYGSVRVPLADIWAVLQGEHTGGGRYIVWNLRLPRVLLAAFVGVNLALAGAILQSLSRNPLAEPNLLGISAGAGLAAVLTLRLAPAVPFTRLPVVAFGGALLGALLVYGLAWRGGVSPLRLVLAGVAVGALLTAFTTGILLTSQVTVQTTMSWLAGGLGARTWPHLRAFLPYCLIGAAATFACARTLDVLSLGDDSAAGLGLRVQRWRALLTGLVALLTGSAVAVAGIIGFVGLIVPHIARLLVGPRHGYLLAVSALLGASLLVAADAVARTIAAPRELPIGIVTAVAGAPFFLWLLRRVG